MRDHDISTAEQFTRVDRRRLARALTGAREARLYRRLEALLLVAEGHSISEAARRMHVRCRSVQRWTAPYLLERDPSALADRGRHGRPRVAAAWVRGLTPTQARRKSGMASKHFWMKNLRQNFWLST